MRQISANNFEDAISTLGEKNLVVIGAPEIGKSYELNKNEEVTHVETLTDVVSAVKQDEKKIAIDDFYLCYREYQAADPESRECEAFEALLSRTQGVCLSTRPYSLEYLIEQYDALTRHGWEDTEICALTYDKETARRQCENLDPKANRDGSTTALDDLHYQYSFDVLGETYDTYIPALALSMADREIDRGILQRGADAALDRVSKDGDIAGFINQCKSAFEKGEDLSEAAIGTVQERLPVDVESFSSIPVDGETVSGLSLIAGAGVSYIGLPLAIGLLLDHDDPETLIDEKLGSILGDELLPPAQEELEQQLGLEPMTLASLQELTTPGTLQGLRQDIESNRDAVDTFRNKLGEYESAVETLNTLDDALPFEEFSHFFSEELATAVRPVETITDRHQNYQTQVLLDELEFDPEQASDTVADLHENATRPETLINEYGYESLENEMIPIRGQAGIGKSSYLRQVAEQMNNIGIETGLVRTDTKEVLHTRVRSLAADHERVALFVQYDTQQLGPAAFRELFGEELYADWDYLFVEVTDTGYPSLQRVWNEIRDVDKFQTANRLEPTPAYEVSLSPLDTVEPIPRELGIDDEAVVGRIESASDGNPLIAFEASVLSLKGRDDAVRGLSQREVLAKRFEGVIRGFEDTAGPGVNPRAILEILAVSYEIKAEEDSINLLVTVADVNNPDRAQDFVSDEMSNYVTVEDGICRLQPSIYRSLVFDRVWFGDNSLSKRMIRPTTCQTRLADQYPLGLVGIILNLGEHNTLSAEESNQGPSQILDSAMTMLDVAVETPIYDVCLAKAADMDLPLPLSEISPETLAAWIDEQAISATEEERLFRSIGSLSALQEPFEKATIEKWGDFAADIYESIESPANPRWADLTAMYSFMMMPMVDEGAPSDPLFGKVTDRVTRVSTDAADHRAAITNYFSLILWPQVRNRSDPEIYTEWFEVIEQQLQELTTQPYRESAYTTTYALLVSRLAPSNPEPLLDWIVALESRLMDKARQEDPVGPYVDQSNMDDRVVYLRQFYGTVVAAIGDTYPNSPEATRNWVQFALTRLKKVALEMNMGDNLSVQQSNLQRGIVLMLGIAVRYTKTIENRSTWLNVLIEEAEQFAVNQAFLPQAIGDVHAVPLAAAIARTKPEQVSKWVSAVESPFKESSADFDFIKVNQTDDRFTLCILTAGALMKFESPEPGACDRVQQLSGNSGGEEWMDPVFYALALQAIAHTDGPARISGWMTWIDNTLDSTEDVFSYLVTDTEGVSQDVLAEMEEIAHDPFSVELPLVFVHFVEGLVRSYEYNAINEAWIDTVSSLIQERHNDRVVSALFAVVAIKLSRNFSVKQKQNWLARFHDIIDSLEPTSRGRFYLVTYVSMALEFNSTHRREGFNSETRSRLAWIVQTVLAREEAFADILALGEEVQSRDNAIHALEDIKPLLMKDSLIAEHSVFQKVNILLIKRERETPEGANQSF